MLQLILTKTQSLASHTSRNYNGLATKMSHQIMHDVNWNNFMYWYWDALKYMSHLYMINVLKNHDTFSLCMYIRYKLPEQKLTSLSRVDDKTPIMLTCNIYGSIRREDHFCCIGRTKTTNKYRGAYLFAKYYNISYMLNKIITSCVVKK